MPATRTSRTFWRTPRSASRCPPIRRRQARRKGTTGPHRHKLTWTEGGDLSGEDDGIGRRTYNGTRTLYMPQITGLSDTAGLKVGMLLSDTANWNGTDPVRIVGIDSGTQVTVSETASGTATEDMTFLDAIMVTIDATDYFYPADYAVYLVSSVHQGLADPRVPASSLINAFGVGDAMVLSATNGLETGKRTVYLESILCGGTGFLVCATHGAEYEPPLATIDNSGDATQSENDVFPNGITWSKPFEYEHVPEENSDVVGDGKEGDEILRIVHAQDALWVFLRTGLWRVSGDGALTGFRIDQIDPTLVLLAPEAVAVLDDVMYAWTIRGIVAITGGGAPIPLSEPRFGSSLSEVQGEQALSPFGTLGCFACANNRTNEVFFGIPAGAGDNAAGAVYVYNAQTTAFTRWFAGELGFGLSCAAVDPSDGAMVFGSAAEGQAYRERVFAGEEFEAVSDEGFDVVIDTVDDAGTVITLVAGSGFEPRVGDAIKQGGSWYVITAVEDVGELTQITLHAPGLTAEVAEGFHGYGCAIEWTTQVDGVPSAVKAFGTTYLHLLDHRGMRKYLMRYASSVSTTRADVTRSMGLAAEPMEPLNEPPSLPTARDDRVHVPRDHARAVHLFPRVEVLQAGARFLIGGLTVESRQVSGRTTR